MIELPYLDIRTPFPPVSEALNDPNGLLAYGATLDPFRLFEAYSNGIFPWFSDDEPILWWSPNPRAIIELDNFHVSKSLQKLIRQARYTVTLNNAFTDVIAACATIPRCHPHGEEPSSETWITKDMIEAYTQLHIAGIAHSVEVWDEDNTLAGGLYGVAVGGVFCGESMFHKRPNTSKLAMCALVNHMRKNNLGFIDCQLPTEHLSSLGAITLPRDTFISRLQKHNATIDSQGHLLSAYKRCWQSGNLTP
ncbi:leucyl/phenylalanyl-tRNA--protein transferase [Aestuariibacter sp. A3R04]|uniref:leucyl/phenylalanyl-tRNA--protein transferase n=1 Tax=Aestuariibacter sp. A3R04 TaxID=2841571 RepID=UPI001C097B53|nr:leucyl/phenylalanyl-tRNA--protein transferase [Aestuariibacter sp. A3R04]MBU3023080.1 leucyl/phenylalanyl-tRNA--protein transferase [Aestuariibacter sp. A3R04]